MNILIVYCLTTQRLRPSQREHLESFRRYSNANCYYLNVALFRVPAFIRRTRFDLVIYDWFFLEARRTKQWERIVARVRGLKGLGDVKVALPQDECTCTDQLCGFITEFDIDVIFSVAPESEWPVIYDKVDRKRRRFERVLTGYIDEQSLDRVEQLRRVGILRTIDVGYRSAYKPQWGRFGVSKRTLAEVFRDRCREAGLRVDVSDQVRDFLIGDDWYKFLLKCRFTFGSESGGSLLDRTGSIAASIAEYVARHPQCDFDEIESNCFPRLDNTVNLRALSPRHLESCMTRTCQILLEGEYSNVLKPGVHYIELRSDLSNLDEVVHSMRSDTTRDRIAQRAYQDIVESGKYSYRSFVSTVLDSSLRPVGRTSNESNARELAVLLLCRVVDAAAKARNATVDALKLGARTLLSPNRFARRASSRPQVPTLGSQRV